MLRCLASSKLISPTKQKQVKLRRILHLCGRKKKASKDNRRRVTKLYQSRGGVRGLIAQIMSEYNVKHSRLVDGLKTGDSSTEGNNTSGKAFMPLYPAPMPITSKALQWVCHLQTLIQMQGYITVSKNAFYIDIKCSLKIQQCNQRIWRSKRKGYETI